LIKCNEVKDDIKESLDNEIARMLESFAQHGDSFSKEEMDNQKSRIALLEA